MLSWDRRNAWRCILGLLALEFGISAFLSIARLGRGPSGWLLRHEPSIVMAIKLFRAGSWIGLTYWCTGLPSPRVFAERTGLRIRPNLHGWLAAWLAIAIAFVDHFGVARGWASPDRAVKGIFRAGGWYLAFFVGYVVSIGPFFEELVLRGFLYPALRASYGCVLGTLLVVGLGAIFHWGAVSHSLWTPACLLSLWVLACYLRGHTGSIWNCILCHAAYNAAGTLGWWVYASGMMVILPFCAFSTESAGAKPKGNVNG
jgi:membrane protease YdiL (CAAX protease family)